MTPDLSLFYGQALEVHFADPWDGGDPMQPGTYRGFKDSGGAVRWDTDSVTIKDVDTEHTYRWADLRYIIKYDNLAEWAMDVEVP